MHLRILLSAITLLVLLNGIAFVPEVGAQPTTASYQGELLESGSPFTGNANFKFAIVSGATNLWANDGTASGEPSTPVPVAVVDGLFSIRLGDTSQSGMTSILTADALQVTNASIRAWVDTGGGFEQLSDVPLTSVPFALQSESARRALSGFDVDGDVQVFESGGLRTVYVNADEGATGAIMFIYDIDSMGSVRPAIELDSREGSGGGVIRLFNGIEEGPNPNEATIEINAQEGSGPGQITLFDLEGNVAIQLDAEMSDGYSRVITDIVQINGGMDVAERFNVRGSEGGVRPGAVVSISRHMAGDLSVSSTPYDKRVAGIISGAGGVNVGMLLGQVGEDSTGEHPVALSGRVYCWADASFGPIEPGDLLTTSVTSGHAMKVTDHDRAAGAVIGKAMSSLTEGRGLVFVLVTLQ